MTKAKWFVEGTRVHDSVRAPCYAGFPSRERAEAWVMALRMTDGSHAFRGVLLHRGEVRKRWDGGMSIRELAVDHAVKWRSFT